MIYCIISDLFRSNVPEEIKGLGYKAMRLYYYAMIKREYVNNLIRCMFVGHWGVGKTTLVKGLLEEDQTGITSTDGIEVYIKRCFFDKDKGMWHIQGISYQDKCRRIHVYTNGQLLQKYKNNSEMPINIDMHVMYICNTFLGKEKPRLWHILTQFSISVFWEYRGSSV